MRADDVLKQALLGIYDPNQKLGRRYIGTGFLVKRNIGITCAHVIADLFPDLSAEQLEIPNVTFTVVFSFSGTDKSQKSVPVKSEANIIQWIPLEQGNGESDIAIFEITKVPEHISPLPLASTKEIKGLSFESFGYSDDSGEWIQGRVADYLPDGSVQLNPDQDSLNKQGKVTHFVTGGFSGGPIWNEKIGKVVGMIAELNLRRQIAYAIPSTALESSWPPLIANEETRYLNEIIDNLKQRSGVREYVDLVGLTNNYSTISKDLSVQSIYEPSFQRFQQKKIEQRVLEKLTTIHEDEPRLLILGDPGAGKTTSIRRLVLDYALRRLHDRSPSNPIPFWVDLAGWSDEYNTIEDYIENVWTLDQSRLFEQIYSGEIILFMDGLNEIGGNASDKLDSLRRWVTPPNNNPSPQKLIIACRTNDYPSIQLSLPFAIAQKMQMDQIREFANNYLGNQADRFLENLAPEQSDSRSNLLSLAQNPYLLQSLIEIFKDNPNERLPTNTGKLFKRLVWELWERERVRGTSGWVEFEMMKQLLSQTAFSIINQNKGVEILQTELDSQVTENFIMAAENANIIIVSNGRFRFFHQLILEYFAAEKLQKLDYSAYISSPKYGRKERKAQRFDHSIVALSGISLDPDAVIKTVARIDPYLAAMCLESGTTVRGHTFEEVLNLLTKDIRTRSFRDNPVRAVMDRYDPLSNKSTRAKVASHALARLGHRAVRHLMNTIENKREEEEVRSSAVMAIGQIAASHNDLTLEQIEWLHARSTDEIDYTVSQIIGHPEVVDILLDLAKDIEEEKELREQALLALDQICDPRIVPELINEIRWFGKISGIMANIVGKLNRQAAADRLIYVLETGIEKDQLEYNDRNPLWQAFARKIDEMNDKRRGHATVVAACARNLKGIESAKTVLISVLNNKSLSSTERAGAAYALGYMKHDIDTIIRVLSENIKDIEGAQKSYMISVRRMLSNDHLDGTMGIGMGIGLFVPMAAAMMFSAPITGIVLAGSLLMGSYSLFTWFGVPDVRTECIEALAQIKNPDTVEILLSALEDDRRSVRIAARNALRNEPFISISGVSDALAEWREKRIQKYDWIDNMLGERIDFRSVVGDIIDNQQ